MKYAIDFLPETITEYSGHKIFDLYRDPEKSILAQEKARRGILDRFGIDIGNPRIFVPTFLTVEVFGGEILYPEDAEPGILRPAIKDITKISAYRLPDSYWEQPCMQYYVKMRDYFSEKSGCLPVLQCNTNGPATSAKMFRGDGFFPDLYEHPRQTKILMEFVTENLIRYREEMSLRQGIKTQGQGMGIWDDVAGMISPQMYAEYVVPGYDKIIRHFQCPDLYLHSEELHPGHLPYIKHLPITCLDLGWERETFLNIEIVKKETDFKYSWNYNYMRDIKEGSPNSIKKLYEQVLKRGGDRLVRIKAGIPRGTPPENVLALIEVAKTYA